jgi:predicted ribosomally synthesized peptide with nif11-like leader
MNERIRRLTTLVGGSREADEPTAPEDTAMSQTEVKRFMDHVQNDPALQSELGLENDANAFIAAVVRLGSARGFSLTPDDVRAEMTPSSGSTTEALSDAELEAVAGGGFIAMMKCALTISGGTCSRTGGGVGCLSGTARS